MPNRSRILIVDDDASTLALLTGWLTKEGYECSTARSGEAALTQIAQSPPDLILLDLKFPPPDGLEILRQVKEASGSAGIQVVVMTVERDPKIRIECLDKNADGFINKPFEDLDELAAILRFCLRKLEKTRLDMEHAQQLERLSVTDPLTGLSNKRYLRKCISNEFNVSQRHGTQCRVYW